jgi:hypothetical protein
VKVNGSGPKAPLSSFSVSLTPDQPELLKGAYAYRWSLRSFQSAPNYAWAIVGEGKK